MARTDAKDTLDYVRWYWRDWRSSTAFLSMTPLARGIYRELCDAHYGERDCSLPAEDRALALCAAVPLDVWLSVKAEVMPYLRPVKVAPGTPRLRNSRTYSEWKAAKEARRNKREAGRLGGKQKASNARATLQQNPSNALAVSAPSPSPSPLREEKERADSLRPPGVSERNGAARYGFADGVGPLPPNGTSAPFDYGREEAERAAFNADRAAWIAEGNPPDSLNAYRRARLAGTTPATRARA